MRRRGSVKDWLPDPIQEVLDVLVRHSIDSSDWKEWPSTGNKYEEEPPSSLEPIVSRAHRQLTGVAKPTPYGTLMSFHVTDHPEQTLGKLLRHVDLIEDTKYLGRLCGGLMVSTVPDYWKARVSAGRYEFLSHLSSEEKARLADLIMVRLDEEVASHYITASEYERASEGIRAWTSEGHTWGIDRIIDQPYNIDVPTLARQGRIANPKEPEYVRVVFRGLFLDLGEQEARDAMADLARLVAKNEEPDQRRICTILRDHWWDGVFTASGFSTEAQMHIMNGGCILSYGEA